MDRGHQPSRPISAEADTVPASRPEAGVVKNVRARNDELDRLAQPARGDGGKDRLHLQRVLLAESATRIRRNHVHLIGFQPQLPLGSVTVNGLPSP